MTTIDATRSPVNLGVIEFELTDLADARKALDDLPAGIATIQTLTPGYWESRRRGPEAADRALTGIAIDWMMSLSAHLRPAVMSLRFPRLVNCIATAWSDPAACDSLLDQLLHDRRPGRRGFPAAVRGELEALRAARAAAGSAAST